MQLAVFYSGVESGEKGLHESLFVGFVELVRAMSMQMVGKYIKTDRFRLSDATLFYRTW
jgi:hypothetical protein